MSFLSALDSFFSRPVTSLFKRPVSSVFCDFRSAFLPTAAKHEELLGVYGLKWPDDFDITKQVGSSDFQVIRDFENGLFLYSHEGALHPYTKKKILERKHKVKEISVRKRIGDRTPFLPDNVFLLETGLNAGNVEFMTFDLRKKKQTSFESYRVIAYSFPLFWLLNEVVTLEEMKNSKGVDSDRVQELEKDRILKNKELNGWTFSARDTSPSADQYLERNERPLHDYHFSRDEQVHVWLKFEFFGA